MPLPDTFPEDAHETSTFHTLFRGRRTRYFGNYNERSYKN